MPISHHPDGWTILKFIDGETVAYKIFATWRWENDKWRLSSGAEDLSGVSRNGDEFIWPQASGSTYHLPVGGEHCYTAYQGMVLENIKTRSIEEKIEFEIVSLNDFFALKYNQTRDN